MNYLKIRRSQNILPILIFVIMLILSIYYLFFLWQIADRGEDLIKNGHLGMGILTLTIIGISLWLHYLQTANQIIYQIKFEEGIINETIPRSPIVNRKSIQISKIEKVSYKWPGILSIYGEGDRLDIHVHAIEGGISQVIWVLKANLPEKSFDENQLRYHFATSRRLEFIYSFGNYFILSVFLLGLFGNNLFNVIPVGWNIYKWGLDEKVTGFSIQPDHSVWVAVQGLNGNTRLEHHTTQRGIQTLDLPIIDETDTYSQALIIIDEMGNPTIFSYKSIIQLNSGGWEKLEFSDNFNIPLLKNNIAYTHNEIWWFPLFDEHTFLAHYKAGQKTIENIPPPSNLELNNSPVLISNTNDGKLYLFASNTIFEHKNGNWQIIFANIPTIEDSHLYSFTYGPDNSYYLLYLKKEDPTEITLQKIHNDQISSTKIKNEIEGFLYSNLIVDSNERVWLMSPGYGVMSVFEAKWGAIAKPLVTYNEFNSSYSSDTFLNYQRAHLDYGKIWTHGNRLVWIDSTKGSLPKPLPAWSEWFISYKEDNPLFFAFIFIIIITIWHFTLKHINRKKLEKMR